jgi:LPXTG-motif cell wall-anchored protein
MSFDVYVNDSKVGSYKFDNNNTPIPISLDSVTTDTKVLVKVTSVPNCPNGLKSITWTDPQQVLDDSTSAPVGGPVSVDANSGWTHNWDNLAKDDGNGNQYYYTVKELGYTVGDTYHDLSKETDGSYTVSYGGNTGIQTGVITVTNSEKENQGYELPSTGGTPSPLPWVGGTLAALAGVLLVRRMRPRRS